MPDASRPTSAGNANKAADGAKNRTNVGNPGIVVSYDEAKQTCTVQLVPQFGREDPAQKGAVQKYTAPAISNVPVIWPGTKNAALTFPLEPGDSVQVLFCDRSIEEWKSTAASSTDPQDPRRHDLSDAVVIPGLVSPASPRLVATYAAGAVVLSGPELRLGDSTASEYAAQADKVDTALLALVGRILIGVAAARGEGSIEDAFDAFATAFVAYSPDTACTKVKVK